MSIDRRQFIQISAASIFLDDLCCFKDGAGLRIRRVGARGRLALAFRMVSEERSVPPYRSKRPEKSLPVCSSWRLSFSYRARRFARCSPGRCLSRSLEGNRLAVTYEGVNGTAKITVTWPSMITVCGLNQWHTKLRYSKTWCPSTISPRREARCRRPA